MTVSSIQQVSTFNRFTKKAPQSAFFYPNSKDLSTTSIDWNRRHSGQKFKQLTKMISLKFKNTGRSFVMKVSNCYPKMASSPMKLRISKTLVIGSNSNSTREELKLKTANSHRSRAKSLKSLRLLRRAKEVKSSSACFIPTLTFLVIADRQTAVLDAI